MSFELREGQGSLFKNDKRGNEKAPDYTGNILIEGIKKRIAAWVKDGKNGKYLSLKISEYTKSEQSTEPLPF